MKLFGTDGIRAKFGQHPMTLGFANHFGSVIGAMLNKGDKVLIGRDTRSHGVDLFFAIRKGLEECGITVDYIDVIPTPVLSFYLKHTNKYKFGVMISASHNPAEYNGIKLFKGNGEKIDKETVNCIESQFNINDIDEKLDVSELNQKDVNHITDLNQYADSCSEVFQKYSKNKVKDIKIAIDCANGATYKLADDVFKKCDIKYTLFNNKPNGNDINHECGSTHEDNIVSIVKNGNFDIGIAFDGDGDRLILCSKDGIIDGDNIIAVLARELKQKQIVGTVMSNLGLEIYLSKLGVSLFRPNVGDKYVIEEMHKHNLTIGGEQSGHILCYPDIVSGDGIKCAAMLLGMYFNSDLDLAAFFHPFKKTEQYLFNIEYSVNKYNKDQLVTELQKKYERFIVNDHQKILVRPSGTENLIRIMFDGHDLDIESIKKVINSENFND